MTNGKVTVFALQGLRKILKISIVLGALTGLLAFRGIRLVSENFEALFEYFCVTLGAVYFASNPLPAENEMQPTFTGKEIDLMAGKIRNQNMTIQEIKEHFDISYRQARKVKERKDSLMDIQQYSAKIH